MESTFFVGHFYQPFNKSIELYQHILRMHLTISRKKIKSWNRQVLHKCNRCILLNRKRKLIFSNDKTNSKKFVKTHESVYLGKWIRKEWRNIFIWRKISLNVQFAIKQLILFQFFSVVMAMSFAKIVTQDWGLARLAEMDQYLNEIGNLRKLSKAWRKTKSKPLIVVVDATAVEFTTNVDASEFEWEQKSSWFSA